MSGQQHGRPPGRAPKGRDHLFRARLDWLTKSGNGRLIRGGLRGLEKESLRVDASGRVSARPHPPAIGSALTHPYLTTDYSEALVEFVTPPRSTNWQALQFLCDLHVFVHGRLDGGELLWPGSMPCVVDANAEIPIAEYGSSNVGMMKTVYRRGLGHRYGRAMQAIAGVHFNLSLPEAFWQAHWEETRSRKPLHDFRSERFLDLARNYRRYGWLVLYLFGASPALCKSFRPEGHELLTELDRNTWHAPFATSLRMSDIGYRNKTQARLNISLNSPADYIAGLAAAVSTPEPRYTGIGVEVDGEYRQLNANILQIENEYYSPIRPKPSKRYDERPTVNLRRHGVEYVEIRTLDLNPADPVGVNQNQLRFLEALLIYCLLADSPPISPEEQREIDRRDLSVAREGRLPRLELPRAGQAVPLRRWGLELLEQVRAVAELLDTDGNDYAAAVDAQREAVEDAEATPSARLLNELRSDKQSFFHYMLGVARSHHEYFSALTLAPARAAELQELAARSLEEQKALEADDTEPFSRYLARYFAET
ncbi:MAG: glutamate--cysteine ligase [Gammaproteobacteria bacterium]|nr:glutamate--cysteine ligase [Gammaproteobacteria bacterium]